MPNPTPRRAIEVGGEVRLNRDTTYFGTGPNGEYDFGGGTAYSTVAIPSRTSRQTQFSLKLLF